MFWADRLAAGILAPLAMWVLASGLDDLFLDLLSIWRRLKRRGRDAQGSSPPAPEKKIALLIPAWREDAVIEQMLDHNLAAIRYSNYEVFVGVYPNDLPTLSRLRASEHKHPRVHAILCPHDGPTSKADCLNWVYQGLLLYEEEHGCHFDILLHHDAEDLIHPGSLVAINRYACHYDMVQVPVFPLPTPWREWTHGVYCDEFAQSHGNDLAVRVALGGFLPSCGVGTAYRRRVVDRLAWNNGNRLFLPHHLTEDYQIGLEIHRLGYSQILLDPDEVGGERGPAATREYFPRRFRSSVRQKGRWVAGIVFQGWQQVGWDAGPGQWYWLWRDRKALLGHPLTILANLIFLYGLGGWLWATRSGEPWQLGLLAREIPFLSQMLVANTALIVWRQAFRVACTRRVYGLGFALLAPLRSLWGNVINFAATVRAMALLLDAQVRNEAPAWLKTEHHYPSAPALRPHKQRLGEVLAGMGAVSIEVVERALDYRAPGERLGDYLVRSGAVSEIDLYRALSAQQTLPFELLSDQDTEPEALRRLPRQQAQRWQVIPVRITHERYLWVAGPELPTEEAGRAIGAAAGLETRFQLVTPSNYQSLAAALYPCDAIAAGV